MLLHAYLCCLYCVSLSKYSDCAVKYSLLLWWLIHWLTFTLSYMKANVFSRFQTMRQSLSVADSHVLHSFCSRNTVFYSSKIKLSLWELDVSLHTLLTSAIERIGVDQGCTNPWCQVTCATKFCVVVPNICGTCCMLPFGHLEFWSGSKIFAKFVHCCCGALLLRQQHCNSFIILAIPFTHSICHNFHINDSLNTFYFWNFYLYIRSYS